jgi:hypothetical protein
VNERDRLAELVPPFLFAAVIYLLILLVFVSRQAKGTITSDDEPATPVASLSLEQSPPGAPRSFPPEEPAQAAVAGVAFSAPPDVYLTDLSSIALRAIQGYDLDESITPTPEGLYGQTIDLWTSPDFLSLSLSEARVLLGDVPGYDLSGSGAFLGRLGGLPSLEDCQRGLESPAALRLLAQMDLLDLVLVDLDFLPLAQRNQETARAISELHAQRDRTALCLMEELERTTSYKHWSIVHRCFEEFCK